LVLQVIDVAVADHVFVVFVVVVDGQVGVVDVVSVVFVDGEVEYVFEDFVEDFDVGDFL
jgi:hypothetical protein